MFWVVNVFLKKIIKLQHFVVIFKNSDTDQDSRTTHCNTFLQSVNTGALRATAGPGEKFIFEVCAAAEDRKNQ